MGKVASKLAKEHMRVFGQIGDVIKTGYEKGVEEPTKEVFRRAPQKVGEFFKPGFDMPPIQDPSAIELEPEETDTANQLKKRTGFRRAKVTGLLTPKPTGRKKLLG